MDKNTLSLSRYISLNLLTLSVISFLFLFSSSTFAEEAVIDDIDITVPISCSLSGVGTGTHNATIVNGTYVSDIGTTTLKTYCNDTSGFAIYAIGFTEDKYSGADHTKLIGNNSSSKIITGTATSAGNPDVSNWAMKLATNSGATYPITIDNSYNNYSLVPDTYTKVAHRDSGTDIGAAATGAELTTTYAVYISRTESADAFTGKVKYTLVHPANEIPPHPEETASGYIAYYPNTAIYEGSMSDTNGGPVQQLSNNKAFATLLASNFSKDGYGFAGWSDAFDYATNPDAHFYGPNEVITFATGQYSGSNPGLSLYAVWVPSEGNLQDTNKVVELCGDGTVEHPGSLTQVVYNSNPDNQNDWSITADLSSVSALTDSRDNQTYAIAKLSDGKCWMIENLRIEAEATRGSANEALSQGYGKYSGTGTNYGEFIGLANAESANFNSTAPTEANNNTNSIYSSDGSTEININTSNNPGYRIPRYNHINTDSTPSTGTRATSLTASTTYSTTANANIYGYGNYYNWPAAKANTNYFTSVAASNEADTSICPAGWHLPTGSGSGEFGVLSNSLGGYNIDGVAQTMNKNTTPSGNTISQRLMKFPNNIVLSGELRTSSITYRYRNGIYWTSTIAGQNTSYILSLLDPTQLNITTVPGTDNKSRDTGYPIRCISD